MEEFLKHLKEWWPLIVVAAPGLFAVWRQRQTAMREERKDRSDLVKIATDAAGAVIGDLRKEIDRLQGEIEDLQEELGKARKEHADMMANKDARITLLEGEKRQLEAQVAAYEDLLRRHGIEPPKMGQTYWKIEHGAVTPADTGDTA